LYSNLNGLGLTSQVSCSFVAIANFQYGVGLIDGPSADDSSLTAPPSAQCKPCRDFSLYSDILIPPRFSDTESILRFNN
jgi:hypothetical protein